LTLWLVLESSPLFCNSSISWTAWAYYLAAVKLDKAGITFWGSPAELRHVRKTMPVALAFWPLGLETDLQEVKREGSNGFVDD